MKVKKNSKFSHVFQVVRNGIVFELQSEPEGGCTISVPSLPGCLSYGEKPETAYELINDAMTGWLSVAREEGLTIPAQFENYASEISTENQELRAPELNDATIVLKATGFSLKRQTKNHIVLYKSDTHRLLSIPISPTYLPLGTQKAIIRYSGLKTADIFRLLALALGIKNNIVLNTIAVFCVIGAIVLISIPSHIYGMSGVLLAPVVFLSQMFVDRPNIARVALLAFKVRTIFVLIVIPLVLFLYVWPPGGWIFFVWMATYLMIRKTSNVQRQSLAWNRKWSTMASFLDDIKGYSIKFNPIILLTTVILTAAGLLSGYYFAGTKGLLLGAIFSITVWLLNPFVRNIVVVNESSNKTPNDGTSN